MTDKKLCPSRLTRLPRRIDPREIIYFDFRTKI